MRRSATTLPAPADRDVPRTERGDWTTIRTLLPYLWEYKGRVLAAIGCLVLAKVANVGVPVLMMSPGTSVVQVDRYATRRSNGKASRAVESCWRTSRESL